MSFIQTRKCYIVLGERKDFNLFFKQFEILINLEKVKQRSNKWSMIYARLYICIVNFNIS